MAQAGLLPLAASLREQLLHSPLQLEVGQQLLHQKFWTEPGAEVACSPCPS